ncbi:MAG: PDZ domain-containing protein [Akkermansia sp.]
MLIFNRLWMSFCLLTCLTAGVTCVIDAKTDHGTGLEFDKRINGKEMLTAITPLRNVLQYASVAFFRGSELVCYGVVVDVNGGIMTKASEVEVRDGLSVHLGNKVYNSLMWSAVDEAHDVVAVRIPVSDLRVPSFSQDLPELGSIVISNGSTTRTNRRARIGIISGNARAVSYPNEKLPYMGIVFQKPCHVSKVEQASPAMKAGIADGDRIVSMDGQVVQSLEEMGPLLSAKKPGDVLDLQVQRGENTLTCSILLGNRYEYLGDEPVGEDKNDEMSGRMSRRKYGFPLVMQHDTPLLPVFMGGPLLNLEGKVIGMNIARANRAETFSLPIQEVLSIYHQLSK